MQDGVARPPLLPPMQRPAILFSHRQIIVLFFASLESWPLKTQASRPVGWLAGWLAAVGWFERALSLLDKIVSLHFRPQRAAVLVWLAERLLGGIASLEGERERAEE